MRSLIAATGVVVTLLLCLAWVLITPAYALFMGWGNGIYTVQRTVDSPDGRMAAVVYRWHGNATVPFMTLVALHPTNRAFHPDRSDKVFNVRGIFDLRPEWHADGRSLTLAVPMGATIYSQAQPDTSIRIDYVPSADVPKGWQ